MAHIVVLGAGVGGIPMAYEMKQMAGSGHTVTVVNDNPYFQFTPSNPWVGVGWRSKKDITIDLAPVFSKHGIDFVHGSAKKLQAKKNTLELASEGKWVHFAKIAFEKYFMRKIRIVKSEPFYEKYLMDMIKVRKVK